MKHRPIRLAATLALTAAAAAASTARAHFVFVLPDAGGRSARLVMSEALAPDPRVPVAIAAGATLRAGDAALAPDAAVDNALPVALPAGADVIRGVVDLGVQQRGQGKPHTLAYYPKAIVGDPFAIAPRHDAAAGVPVELVPVGSPGQLIFRLLVDGKPAADAELTVIEPGGAANVYKTDGDGLTATFAAPGRYGAWARRWLATPGTRDGKAYDEVRQYATLVVDAPAAGAATMPATAPTTMAAAATTRPLYPAMPERASSFGAAAAGGWLYVYGGHVSDTHSYSTASVSGQFHRVRLDGAGNAAWEPLPGGTGLQGLNLAAWRDDVIRVGGMRPRNAPGTPADIHSVAEAARFDARAGRWESLPPLPEPRSSHDVATIGDTLYVVGGWRLDGDADGAAYARDMLALDLAAPERGWRSIEQPFARRAFIAAVHGGKLYVIGGLDETDSISRSVDVYDPATDAWTPGPGLPGSDFNGFGPAAVARGDELFVSVGDGTLLRLNEAFNVWDKAGETAPRIVHRMVVDDAGRLVVLGGAQGRRQTDRVETVEPAEASARR